MSKVWLPTTLDYRGLIYTKNIFNPVVMHVNLPHCIYFNDHTVPLNHRYLL